VRNANSTQHLRYSQRISEILRKIKSAKRASDVSPARTDNIFFDLMM